MPTLVTAVRYRDYSGVAVRSPMRCRVYLYYNATGVDRSAVVRPRTHSLYVEIVGHLITSLLSSSLMFQIECFFLSLARGRPGFVSYIKAAGTRCQRRPVAPRPGKPRSVGGVELASAGDRSPCFRSSTRRVAIWNGSLVYVASRCMRCVSIDRAAFSAGPPVAKGVLQHILHVR